MLTVIDPAIAKTQLTSPTALATGVTTLLSTDERSRQDIVSSRETYARFGNLYHGDTDIIATTTQNETAFLSISNPSTSGKVFKMGSWIFGAGLQGNLGAGYSIANLMIYRFYQGSTGISGGTAITNATGGRQTGQITSVATALRFPTVTTKGTLFRTVYGASADVNYDFAFSHWLDPGFAFTVTVAPQTSGNLAKINFEWVEV